MFQSLFFWMLLVRPTFPPNPRKLDQLCKIMQAFFGLEGTIMGFKKRGTVASGVESFHGNSNTFLFR
jgi:hypothetical protein